MKRIAAIIYKHPFWLFLLFMLVAYFPVLLPFFHLKNDILTQNLPTRFVFGESLYSGFEPFWNPYLHYGNPQYGDMNNGFWNPIQWIIGATTGYNIYTITLEELFYILIGGWGMYKVTKEFFTKDIALLTGLVYICCGYITGHLQYLCWITGTAFFPFVLLFFIRVNKSPTIRNYLWGAISVFLFVASTHPGLIIGAAYFFVFALLIIYFNRKHFTQQLYHSNFWLINLVFLAISCALSLVVIISNVEVLQYISRGNKVSLDQALWAPTTLQSYISTLLPLPVHKSSFFDTDIGMRNVYFSLIHFAGLLLLFRLASRRSIISLGIPLLFFALLSAGGFFKTIAWNIFPFIGHVRLNGEFTYFVILLFLFGGAAGLHYSVKENKEVIIKKLLNSLFWVFGILVIVAILVAIITHDSIFYFDFPSDGSIKERIKFIIDKTSFWDLVLLQAIIQLLTIYLLNTWRTRRTAVLSIFSVNLLLITWFTLPFTGLGMMSKKEVQLVLNEFPRGIPTSDLTPINKANYIHPADESQFMLIASYSKRIGHPNPDQYPVQLKSNAAFVSDTALFNFINSQAFLFLSTDSTIPTNTNFEPGNIQILSSGPGYTKCIINNSNYRWLNFLQNNYPYWSVKMDGKPILHYTSFKTFIAVPIEPGMHTVEFSFEPTRIKTAMWINLGLLIIALILLCIPNVANKSLFK